MDEGLIAYYVKLGGSLEVPFEMHRFLAPTRVTLRQSDDFQTDGSEILLFPLGDLVSNFHNASSLLSHTRYVGVLGTGMRLN